MNRLLLASALASVALVAHPAVVYDNGPWITGPVTQDGTETSNGWQWSEGQYDGTTFNTVSGFDCNAFTNNSEYPFTLTDDFTLQSSSHLTRMHFFAYQPGALVRTMWFASIRIWRGRPDQPGSTLVYGNATTNRMVSSGFTHVWRTPNSVVFGAEERRAVCDVTVSLDVTLPAGTYWAEWSIAGDDHYNGPFNVMVTIPGMLQKLNSNSLSWVNELNSWFNNIDWDPVFHVGSNLQQDLAFTIEGDTGPHRTPPPQIGPPPL